MALQGAALYDMETRLRSSLEAALQQGVGAGSGVAVNVQSPPEAEGFITVSVVCTQTAQQVSQLARDTRH